MLTSIITSTASLQPVTSHEAIEVITSGLVGDRYATGKGHYSGDSEWDAPVTLIQQEPFDELQAEHGLTLTPMELRRNLVTRNINLSWLIGKDFQIGDTVILRGRKVWPPCLHIIKQTGKGEMFKHIAKHCGIGADVVVGGTIRVGDAIFAVVK